MDKEHWESGIGTIQSCPTNTSIGLLVQQRGMDSLVKELYGGMTNDLGGAVYGGIIGLVLSTFYYVFKTDDPTLKTKWRVRKLRVMMGLIFVCTVSSIAGVLFAWAALVGVYAAPRQVVCDNAVGNGATATGVGAMFVGGIVGMYLMC